MQKISFGGKDYVRVSEVAKKFRYTQDYVGQLCRSKKVDARLVGRSWYVVLESVAEYRKTKHKTQKSVAQKKSVPVGSSPATRKVAKQVEPVQRTKTIRLAGNRAKKAEQEKATVAYTADESVLIPVVSGFVKTQEKLKPKKSVVTIESKSAISVPVQSEDKRLIDLKAEKNPEISLSGTLSVTDHLSTSSHESDEDGLTISSEKTDVPTSEVAVSSKANFTPSLVITSVVTKQKNDRSIIWTVLMSIVFASAIALVILSASAEVSIEAGEYTKSISFSFLNSL